VDRVTKPVAQNFLATLLSGQPARIFCRVALGGVFILAAVGKIAGPQDFAQAVAGYRILPLSAVNLFAIIVPWLELLVGLSLWSGILIRSGVAVAAALNVMFIVAAASAMARGLNIECGCFTLSHAHERVGWAIIGRDLALLALCVPIFLTGRQSAD